LYQLIKYIVTKLKIKPAVNGSWRITTGMGKTIVTINDKQEVFHKSKDAEKYLLDHGIKVKLGD
jgi:hypothetical protein